jgi:hypothetical protein
MELWTKERCKEEALKYSNRTDFRKGSYCAYNWSRKNSWLDDICKHMKLVYLPDGYWTKEKCKEDALKYKTRQEFKSRSSASYSIMNMNGWSNEICSHMNYMQLPNGYWTKEQCHQDALKYEYKHQFQKNSKSAYSIACKNGWIDEICMHMKIIGNRYERMIYVYEFSNNYAYVGLTFNLDKRNAKHLSQIEKKLSPVADFIRKTSQIPILKKLTNYMPVDMAQNLEKFYIQEYKNNGWILINKLVGGGLGYSKFKK